MHPHDLTAAVAWSAAALALTLFARSRVRCVIIEDTAECKPKKRKQHADELPQFFAKRDGSGNLSINLRFIDNFLRWECGRRLLSMGLFPNAQEISESVACLETVAERLCHQISLKDSDVVAIVVGDGRTPRTAALLALRTKWNVVSIDPALHGLSGNDDTAVSYGTLPKELRHKNLEAQEKSARARSARERLRDELSCIDRLSICACRVQDAVIRIQIQSTVRLLDRQQMRQGAAIALRTRYHHAAPRARNA